ncbi:MAG: DUF2892 domain-containing protein [Actinobacteria bacterium]|nr:DUF2892 domain-containing protein [Actinomycetota bacterium]NIU71491.1 DUF2892 domain-containing protein [Actinomycetota bacterium]NIW33458.1 DUF2892 domain-containing protein [Actinomycetota bacterium]
MIRNMGRLDRALRFTAGAALIPAGLLPMGGWQGDVIGLAIAGFALVPLATSVTGVCPLYFPFGVSTLRREQIPAGQHGGAEGKEVPVR